MVMEMREDMRHRPRTAPGPRSPLAQINHQDVLFEYCFILTLPECLLRTILKYLDVPALIRLAAHSEPAEDITVVKSPSKSKILSDREKELLGKMLHNLKKYGCAFCKER